MGHAHHQPKFGRTRAAILTALEEHPREEMTTHDVARIAGVPLGTTKTYLEQLRNEKLVHSRRAVTLFRRPNLWSRWTI